MAARDDKRMVTVGVYGAAGFVAGRLLRLLAGHPQARMLHAVSASHEGEPLDAAHPALRGLYEMAFEPFDLEAMASGCDVVFLCKGHGKEIGLAGELVDAGTRIIDMSGDYRLKDAALFKQWYGVEQTDAAHLAKAVYGLPELHGEELAGADLVANPGCYPTAVILGLAPLLAAGLLEPEGIAVDAVSGASGAGRSGDATQFLNVADNLRPYKIGTHQHTPEMESELTAAAGKAVTVSFVPHIAPFPYGILATMHCRAVGAADEGALQSALADAYAGKPFVRVLPAGELPQLADVVGTNYCDLAVTVDAHAGDVIVSAALDNAVKGASGQAVQNMNLMFGLAETAGL